MKVIVDAQRDVSHPVLGSQIILNLPHDLNPYLSSIANNIADFNPLLDYTTAREKLVLKELHLANKGKVATQTMLYASSSSCDSDYHSDDFSSGASGQGVIGHHGDDSGQGSASSSGCLTECSVRFSKSLVFNNEAPIGFFLNWKPIGSVSVCYFSFSVKTN